MRTLRLHSISFIMLAAIACSITAQDVMDTVVHLNEVMILSQRPMKDRTLVASEIDSISIRDSGAKGLGELLSNNSIIYIRSYGYGALSTASFRGASASHTRVFWNDMEINDPASGQVDFSLVPVYFIDEIKLYHGGSSIRHSAGGLGGTILLNSRPAWKDGTRLNIGQSYGSFNTWNTNVSVSTGNDNWYFKIKTYHETSDNDFSYTNTANGLNAIERYEGADFRKTGLQGDVYLRNNERGIFSMHAWLQNSDRNFAPVMSYMGPGRKENQLDRVIRWVSRYKFYGDLLLSEISLGAARNETNYYLKAEKDGNYMFDTQSNSMNFFGRYEGELGIGLSTRLRTESSIGFKNSRFEDIKNISFNSASRMEAGSSLSLLHEFKFPVAVYALLRMDVYGGKLSPVSPAAGIEYSPKKLNGISFRSNISHNYHFPDLNDLYWIPGGNPSLLPENGYMTDLSMDYQLNNRRINLNTSLTAFYSLIDNWILWKPGEYGFWKAENIDRVKSRGLEHQFSVKYRSQGFSIHAMATYAVTRVNSIDESAEDFFVESPQLIYTPLHKGNMNLSVNPGQFKFRYQYLCTGRRFTTTDNDPELVLDPFQLHNFIVSRSLSLPKFTAELGAGIYNLFDTDYQVIRSRPMPGRHYNLMLKLSF